MFFTVIIPTCNRNALLSSCLDLLAPGVQTIDPNLYEVIVTDDSRENSDMDMIRQNYKWTKIVKGPQRGPAANRNHGVTHANGDWLIFLDDDCLPDKKLLEAYNQAQLCYKNFSVFEGRIFNSRSRSRMDEEAPLNESGGYLWSCNFMIKKDLFESLNGFNELFPSAAMEDVEFSDRVKLITSIKFVFEANVLHPWRIVGCPFLKWKNALEAHKIYVEVYPPGIKRFTFFRFLKVIIYSFIFQTLPEIVKFRGRGFLYRFYYHVFQIRLLIFCLLKNVKVKQYEKAGV